MASLPPPRNTPSDFLLVGGDLGYPRLSHFADLTASLLLTPRTMTSEIPRKGLLMLLVALGLTKGEYGRGSVETRDLNGGRPSGLSSALAGAGSDELRTGA